MARSSHVMDPDLVMTRSWSIISHVSGPRHEGQWLLNRPNGLKQWPKYGSKSGLTWPTTVNMANNGQYGQAEPKAKQGHIESQVPMFQVLD